jgi:hypothetical protein
VTDLWFDRDLGRLDRRGGMLYAARPGELWAVYREELAVPGVPQDPAQQARELLGEYGSMLHGAGHLLVGDGVALPPSLEAWAIAQDRPAAELGGWEPSLVTVDGEAHLALRRDFGDLRFFATTFGGGHLIALTPGSQAVASLLRRDDLDAPAPGWDQFGP